MIRSRLVALCSLAGAVVVFAALTVTLPVAADPATVVRYPRSGATTTYRGLAFDTCTAPPLTTMQAWRASPYRAVGVYIGGVNRGCRQPELTASWVTATTRMGWRLLPVYVGRQARCGSRPDAVKIRPALAADQGRQDGQDAAERARALGMRPGTAVYADMEHYAANAPRCRDAVLEYLSAWVRQMHRRGYLAGVYAHQDSGALHLAQAHGSRSHARPDALWIARWDLSDSLTGWPTVPNAYWRTAQRAKQYRGDHLETWGGVTLNIDNDRLSAPVATVARAYRVTGTTRLRARTGPAPRHPVARTYAGGTTVAVVCQTNGRRVRGSRVWDNLASGVYVPDAFLTTPGRGRFTRALPRCGYGYQVRAPGGAPVHARPRVSRRVVATLPAGALARVVCQRRGSTVGRTSVWNKVGEGRWVSDRHVATPRRTGFTRAIPRC
ncbi:MAG TPA: glycoside hydrolase domain-containing protein [Nocardioidaceae bacterium]|nr:glycoside hydrolase domain-containing protein [Nocardioidaceae bacterium]